MCVVRRLEYGAARQNAGPVHGKRRSNKAENAKVIMPTLAAIGMRLYEVNVVKGVRRISRQAIFDALCDIVD